MEDISILLLLGSAGIIVTIILCITGKRKKTEEKLHSDFEYINIFVISVSIISLIYLFRLTMMFFTGVMSGFYILAIVGGIIALLPLVVIGLLRYKTANRAKVQ